MGGLVFALCISGCANNKEFVRDTSESEKTDRMAKFREDSDEKDKKYNSHPIALYDADKDNSKKTSFWNRLSGKPSDELNTWDVDTKEAETLYKPSLLIAAEQAEQSHDYNQAENLYRQFINDKAISKTKSEYAKACGRYGILLTRKGDYENAEPMFLKSLDLNPNDHDIAGAYAQVLFIQKRYSDSAAIARHVVNRHGEDPTTCYFLGESLLAMQRYQEGFRYLKKSIGEPDARLRMAQAYDSNGDVDAAQYAMQKHDQYYISRGMTPPSYSRMQVATPLPQQTSPMSPSMVFPSYGHPFPMAQSAAPPNQILQPPTLEPVQNLISRNPLAQSENPLSTLQAQRKQPLPASPGQTQNEVVKIASPLTLSQKVSVSKESKIE